MDYPNNNTELRKHKHLNLEERMLIQIRLKKGLTAYKIVKELCRQRGTTTQIKQCKSLEVYPADTGQLKYEKHRRNLSCLQTPIM